MLSLPCHELRSPDRASYGEGQVQTESLASAMRPAICLCMGAAIAVLSSSTLAQSNRTNSGLTDRQARSAIVPFIRATTDCIAKQISEDARFPTFARDGKTLDLIPAGIARCLPTIRAMIEAHDRYYGTGSGDAFFQGEYSDDLTRALNARLKTRVQEAAARNSPAGEPQTSNAPPAGGAPNAHPSTTDPAPHFRDTSPSFAPAGSPDDTGNAVAQRTYNSPPTFLQGVEAAPDKTTTAHLFRDSPVFTPDDNYKPTIEELSRRMEGLPDKYRSNLIGVSSAHSDYLTEQARRQFANERTLGRLSAAQRLAVSVLVGLVDPVNLLLWLGAIGIGWRVAAAAGFGRIGQCVAGAAGGAIGKMTAVGLSDALGKVTEGSDYAYAAILGAGQAGVVLASICIWRWIRADAHRKAAISVRRQLGELDRERRFGLVMLLLWIVLLLAYWFIANPYRHEYGPAYVGLFLLWLILPPVVTLGALKALKWASRGTP